MGIFRGVGGTGNSTDDGIVDAVTEQAVIATNKAGEALNSANSASSSASSATTSASSASTSATNAATSATAAQTAQTAAETAETNAESSATSASTSASTATTKASEASTSATNAATSETNAATSASTATTKASEAATSATTATTKASEASTSATNAATSETNAATSASTAITKASEASTSAASAASSYDDFDDRYLGAKSSAPSTDNDGDALVTGALYFDTSSDAMKVWSGSAWLDAYASLSGALIATNNLSDLNNAGTARTNLGLGTAATTASTDYATAAQGTTADNALPKSGGAMTGAITTNSTFDGRDVSADGTKLDGIEAGATADQTAAEIKTAYESNADTNAFTDADHTKLDGIEASADITDTANVTAAGALMDSELTSEASVKALNQGVATTDSPTFAGLTVDTDTLYVDSTNNRVGMGTTSPSNDLHVSSTTGSAKLTSTGGGANLFMESADGNATRIRWNSNSNFTIRNDATSSDVFNINQSGNVGIGTTSPDRPLTVNGFAHFGSTDCGVTAGDNGGVASVYGLTAAGTTYKPFEIRTGAAGTGFYQTTSGNVGIGQTAPSSLLHIGDAGAINPKLFIETTLTGNIPAGVTLSVDNTSGDVDLQTQSPSPNPKLNFNAATTTFRRSGAEKMRLNNTGLGIGTTSPSEELHVVGQALMQGATSYGAAVCKVELTGGSFGTGLRVEAGGSNTTGQTAYFQTNSSAKNVTFANGSVTSIFCTFNKYQSSPAGNIRMTNNVLQYQVLSDARAKENIVDAGDAGSKIDAIQVRQFDWIEGGLHEDFGFIAQELAPIVPIAVGGEPDGEEMMGVDASKLIPLMVKEIQSLRARVAALEE